MAWIPLFVQILRKVFNVLDSRGSQSFVKATGFMKAPVTIGSQVSLNILH